jgi:hemerythrin
MAIKKTSDLIWQDFQHQELFKIIDAIKTDKSSSILNRLSDYIHHHFSMEEEYMRILDYPQIEKHINAHRDFERRINECFNKDYIARDDYRQGLSDYLSDWLTEHVFGIDKDLEKFVLKSRKK